MYANVCDLNTYHRMKTHMFLWIECSRENTCEEISNYYACKHYTYTTSTDRHEIELAHATSEYEFVSVCQAILVESQMISNFK